MTSWQGWQTTRVLRRFLAIRAAHAGWPGPDWRAPGFVDSHRSGTMVYEERCRSGIDTPEVHGRVQG
jgi:hypothetical protein